jgi:hypothetical protein
MRMGKRLGRLGGVSSALIGLAAMAQTGCTMPVDGASASSKGPEEVATTAAAEQMALPNVNCQATGWNVVQALPVSPPGAPVVYQGSVSALLAGLCTAQTPAAPNCDPLIYDFTAFYYSEILGAAGYYYLLRNFNNPKVADSRQWISIPIIDSQPDLTAGSVSYDPTYPGLSKVRFPSFSPGYGYAGAVASAAAGLWPEANGVPEGFWVGLSPNGRPYQFQLRADDYTTFANLMTSTPASDSQVLAQDQTCVLIVDQNNVVLDFSAHLGQWDPNSGCAGCLKGK